jgi:hypothetical protein
MATDAHARESGAGEGDETHAADPVICGSDGIPFKILAGGY